MTRIDPALKGTTFEAALKGAALDEEAKRAARDAEKNALSPRVQARALAEALRGDSPAVSPPAPQPIDLPKTILIDHDCVALLTRAHITVIETGLSHDTFPLTRWQVTDSASNLLDWGVISRGQGGMYTLTAIGCSVYSLWAALWQKDTGMTTELTPTQIGILETGTQYKSFTLNRQQAGKAAGSLKLQGLIQPTLHKGHWEITPEGRAAYETHLAQEAATNDQVYQRTESDINLDDPELQRAVAPELQAARNLAEERLKTIKNQATTIDEMEREDGKKTALIKEMDARIKELTGLSGDGRNNMAEDLEYYAGILTAIRVHMEADGYAQGPIDYVADLRAAAHARASHIDTTQPANALTHIVDAIIGMISEDSSGLTTLDYVVDLRRKASLHDQKDTQIEALRRCVEDLEAKLKVLSQEYREVKRHDLAALILDELCDLMPEAQEYRVARADLEMARRKIQARQP